jgi:crotonobetainyl-CoA:carnitine CoA-transferase CaiB-like acyl-CoA transferase
VLADAFQAKSRDEWVDVLRLHDVPVAPVLRPEEAASDAQTRHLGIYPDWPDVRAFLPVDGLPGSPPLPGDPVTLDRGSEALRTSGWAGVGG